MTGRRLLIEFDWSHAGAGRLHCIAEFDDDGRAVIECADFPLRAWASWDRGAGTVTIERVQWTPSRTRRSLDVSSLARATAAAICEYVAA